MGKDLVSQKSTDVIDGIKIELTDLKEQSGDRALAYAINAQLAVINSIYSANGMISSIDLLFENLKLALQKSANISEKEMIRLNSAIMVNSMALFAEARINYEKKKWKEEGLKLLKQGCDALADSLNSISGMAAAGSITNISADKLMENFVRSRGFIAKFLEYTFMKKEKELELYQMQNEFQRFKCMLLRKIGAYSEMFNKSIIIAELVERFKFDVINDIIEIECGSEPTKPDIYSPIGNFITFTIIILVVTIIDFSQTKMSWHVVLFIIGTVIIGSITLIMIGYYLLSLLNYSIKLNKYNRKKLNIENHYETIVKNLRS